MRRIGIYGGTFDPFHLGHQTIACALKEQEGLDEVWVVPVHRSPFRLDQAPVASAQQRFEMACLATEDLEGFKVLDLEIKKPPPSYTIETVEELTTLYPEEKFYLMLAEDALKDLENWRNLKEILARVSLLIGSRPGAQPADLKGELAAYVEKGKRATPALPIRATEIRKRLKKGLDCSDLLSPKVLDYISQNAIYY